MNVAQEIVNNADFYESLPEIEKAGVRAAILAQAARQSLPPLCFSAFEKAATRYKREILDPAERVREETEGPNGVWSCGNCYDVHGNDVQRCPASP